ncbi:MAG: hypothetical protein MRY76_00235 [Pseudomonadales bacterium]|nr:hypothetical protein [Pseudomonadales bacterium]
MNFAAIDVETANADMASICQVGIATFHNGIIVDEWETLINPEDFFDAVNVSIHGISEKHVVGAPTYDAAYKEIRKRLEKSISVCHTHFDRVSLARACSKKSLPVIQTKWLDSARVARRAWTQCAWRGYGLANVCKIIGYEFNHHNALQDAKAAGMVITAAAEHTGLDLLEWIERVNLPIDPNSDTSGRIKREGNPEGALFGEVIVFTGALSLPRVEAAELAARIGCTVGPGVTKKTTMLVVGDQDVSKLAGSSKSSKHRKAEDLIMSGQPIRILSESDFKEIVFSVESEGSE